MDINESVTSGGTLGVPNPGGKSNGTPGAQLLSAGTLTGEKVVNTVNDDLGKIEEIMLDVSSGRIAYAVLSFGTILGMGGKLFAIPWQALTLDTRNECFILDVDKERLEKAPGFNSDHWPSMSDPKWAASIHTYYDRRPYWE